MFIEKNVRTSDAPEIELRRTVKARPVHLEILKTANLLVRVCVCARLQIGFAGVHLALRLHQKHPIRAECKGERRKEKEGGKKTF